MSGATFRFYGELNDFLSPARRGREIRHEFLGTPTAKDAVEAIGVPHVEVDVLLVNGKAVGFTHHLCGGERIAAYPLFRTLGPDSADRLCPAPPRPAFAVDCHLRKLARLLRLLGFDAKCSDRTRDREIVSQALAEGRILLTRDRVLLKHAALAYGYWVRSTVPLEQAREVVHRFDLERRTRPFERCLVCNGLLAPVAKERVLARIPPKVRAWRNEFLLCPCCDRLYWRGTHHARFEEWIAAVTRPETG